MKRVISWLLDLLYPPKCVICRRLLAAGETEICADCLEALPNFEGPAPQVDGCDVRQYPLETLRRKIGLVPQKALLFKGPIRENLLWCDEGATDDAIYDALKAAQAQEVVDGKPEGLDYEVETGGRNFSGGQRQRLTIARALVRKPEVLILDDSASALDFATDAALRHALRELPWKPAVVIISQRTASIRFADEILVLDDGRLAGRGTHEELLQTCDVYREIYESQFKKEDAR